MRLGCAGCLTFLLLAAAAAGAVWTGIRASGEPALTVDAGTAADGMRAQKKILDIARGRVPEGGRVVLTEGEINAFLTRHLADLADLPFGGVAVRLGGDGTVAFKGRVPLRRAVPLLSTAAGLVPSAWLERPVWFYVAARPRVESRGRRHYLYFVVERFAVGRQPLPASLLKLLLDPVALRALAWPIPDGVGSVTIEPGQVAIRPAS